MSVPSDFREFLRRHRGLPTLSVYLSGGLRDPAGQRAWRVELRHAISFTERKCVGTPLGSALRLAGTMEFSGFNPNVNAVRVDAIRKAPSSFLSNWDAPEPSDEPWAGFRPMTPDSLSIVGKLGTFDNAYVASGHGMYGVTLAPATATAVVEMVETRRVPERLAPFSPNRFSFR